MFCLVTYILTQLISYEFILCCTCYDKLSIKKIGNNINQLVKKINTYNYISKPDINFIINSMEEIKKKQEKLEKEIKEITNGIL